MSEKWNLAEANRRGYGQEAAELIGLGVTRMYATTFALMFTAADVLLWIAHDPYPWWGLTLWHVFAIGVALVLWAVAIGAHLELRALRED